MLMSAFVNDVFFLAAASHLFRFCSPRISLTYPPPRPPKYDSLRSSRCLPRNRLPSSLFGYPFSLFNCSFLTALFFCFAQLLPASLFVMPGYDWTRSGPPPYMSPFLLPNIAARPLPRCTAGYHSPALLLLPHFFLFYLQPLFFFPWLTVLHF